MKRDDLAPRGGVVFVLSAQAGTVSMARGLLLHEGMLPVRPLALRAIFRSLVLGSLGVPLVACGGQVGGDHVGNDGGNDTKESPKDADVPDACVTSPISSTAGPCDVIVEYYACAVPGVHTGVSIPGATCTSLCGFDSGYVNCYATNAESDPHVVLHCTTCVTGRRPAGYVLEVGDGSQELGAVFARIAELEAASIDAFAILERELVLHGAPTALVASARRSRREEIQHARAMRRVAKRFGGSPRIPKVAPRPPRDLRALALDNAIEGCIREAFGALVATHQAMTAKDETIRVEMARIAEDETRHAAFSLALAAWLDGVMDDSARAEVDAARRRALTELEREVDAPVAPALVALAGFPDRAASLRLFTGLREALLAS